MLARSPWNVTHLISVVHGHSHSSSLEVVNIHDSRLAICRRVHQLQLSGSRCHKVGRAVLVTESVTTDADRVLPSWDRSRNALQHDGLAEDGAADDVTNLEEGVGMLECRRSNDIRTVPLGERHIDFRLNSFTRASSGVIVAHLMPTLYLRMAFADSTVTSSFVYSL